MAVYFQLTPKNDPKAKPVEFNIIDCWMCDWLGVKEDPDNWYKGWYDTIGLSLACGKDWRWCRDNFENMDDVIDYLETHFDVSSWAGR